MIKFIQLPQDQALGASDDLWILSETKSSLFLRMNWLLNFQLTAALRHKTPTISKEIEEILSKCELRTMSFSDEAAESPIWLIGSMSHLP